MAILKAKDAAKLSQADRESKMIDLKMELVKAGVTANKAGAKTKEIKRAIARLITFGKNRQEETNKK